MREEDLKEINEKILNIKELYKRNNEILNEIIFNKNNYCEENIDMIKDSILEKNYNFQEIKIQLLDHQNFLLSKNINNEFLFNNLELELSINKFWYKFCIKLYKKEKEVVKYWKEQYFECYKKHFFIKKNLENDNKISNFVINKINKDVQNISVSTPSLKVHTLKM
ncbi:hypothetical protein [Spiroplasma endosymbiont of Thecophora atra]|uniref:hypothetical protein n=2 Tax=unclassified Spiroplasma TaxID=2637901 RepID=UPI0030CF7562